MIRSNRLAVGLLAYLLAAGAAAAQQATAAAAPPAELREGDLRAHVGYLASDALEGRASGTEGGVLAELYVQAHFQRLGLQPIPGQTELRLPFEFGDLQGCNVVGVLPGRDPKLRDKYLAIGAHLDHAGIGGPGAQGFPGEIHNGADDNASGTAGMMELAEWYAAHPPKHSVIFLGFNAEERGLLGSAHLVQKKVLPVDDIVAMVNLDMIGRSNGYLFVAGLGTAKEFHALLDPIFERADDLRLELNDKGDAPSDNMSFYRGGIPAIFFFTNVHDDYHMPSDDADKIDYAGQLRVVRLARECVDALDAAPSLTYQTAPGMGLPANFMELSNLQGRQIAARNAMRGKLGLFAAEAAGGLAVDRLTEGGAAAEAGLQVGDVITHVNGRETRTQEDLRRALGGSLRGAAAELRYRRGEEELTLTATLK